MRSGRCARERRRSSQRLRDRLSQLFRRSLSAHVARPRAFGEDALDGPYDRVAGVLVTEVLEHHRARPDLADGVRDALSGDVGRGPMHRLEHRGELALRGQVRGRCDADRAGHAGSQIGEDVAEEVGPDHDVESVRALHEMRAEDVDVELVDAHVRVLLRHRLYPLVPVGHRDGDAVRLGRRGEMLLRPRLGQVERVAEDPIHALAREGTLLHHHLLVGAFVKAAADGGVLALVVLAHHPEIDVPRFAIAQRRGHARHEADRADVCVLAEPAADRDEETPQRDVIGNAGESNRAEEDCVVLADPVEPVARHHLAVLLVMLAAPGKAVPLELHAELPPSRLEHADSLGHDLVANPVSWNHRDPVALHVCIPHLRTVRRSMVANTTFSTKRPMRMTVKRPAKTLAISNWFLFSKTYHPRPPEPWLTPKTSSAAIKVRQAKAQPIFNPVKMCGNAAGTRICAT